MGLTYCREGSNVPPAPLSVVPSEASLPVSSEPPWSLVGCCHVVVTGPPPVVTDPVMLMHGPGGGRRDSGQPLSFMLGVLVLEATGGPVLLPAPAGVPARRVHGRVSL